MVKSSSVWTMSNGSIYDLKKIKEDPNRNSICNANRDDETTVKCGSNTKNKETNAYANRRVSSEQMGDKWSR
jgi:hypothetical protein